MKWMKRRRRVGWVGETWLIGNVVVVDVVIDNAGAGALGWCCCCLSAAAKCKAEEEYGWAEDEDGCEEEDETGLVMMGMALLL